MLYFPDECIRNSHCFESISRRPATLRQLYGKMTIFNHLHLKNLQESGMLLNFFNFFAFIV